MLSKLVVTSALVVLGVVAMREDRFSSPYSFLKESLEMYEVEGPETIEYLDLQYKCQYLVDTAIFDLQKLALASST
jgi:hypothetical protein